MGKILPGEPPEGGRYEAVGDRGLYIPPEVPAWVTGEMIIEGAAALRAELDREYQYQTDPYTPRGMVSAVLQAIGPLLEKALSGKPPDSK